MLDSTVDWIGKILKRRTIFLEIYPALITRSKLYENLQKPIRSHDVYKQNAEDLINHCCQFSIILKLGPHLNVMDTEA